MIVTECFGPNILLGYFWSDSGILGIKKKSYPEITIHWRFLKLMDRNLSDTIIIMKTIFGHLNFHFREAYIPSADTAHFNNAILYFKINLDKRAKYFES